MADLRARRPGYRARAFAGVAILVQVLLLFQLFVMGLGWERDEPRGCHR